MNKFLVKLILTVSTIICLFSACSRQEEKSQDTNLYRILVADKYGFIDANGNVKIEPQFDRANITFSEGLCFVKNGDRCGYIDTTGSFVFELEDELFCGFDFKNGYATVMYPSWNWGLIDSVGNIIIGEDEQDRKRAVEECCGKFFTIYTLGISDGRYVDVAIVNMDGDTVGVYDSTSIPVFYNGFGAVSSSGKWGYINCDGDTLISATYDCAEGFSEDGFARVKKGDGFYYIDREGTEIISVEKQLTDFHCRRAAVIDKGEKYLINTKGQKICKLDADLVEPFDTIDGLATIVKKGKAMKIDTMGNVVLRTEYKEIGPFLNGIAPARKGLKWGYIDSVGKMVIPFEYDDYVIQLSRNGDNIRALYSEVNDVNCFSYYDTNGNLIWKDIPPKKQFKPDFRETWNKEDYINYFKENISSLDPIEGLYYVTIHDVYVERENPNRIGSNGTEVKMYAVIRTEGTDDFWAYFVDNGDEKGLRWREKFVKIGESNNYAVVNSFPDHPKYGNDTRLVLEDPSKFEIPIEKGRNNWYNFYANYTFVKDYPASSDYGLQQQPEWSGTGFAISDGLIATNHHVINGAKSITIRGINGNIDIAYNGYVAATDEEHDVAIVRIVDKRFGGIGKLPYVIGKTIPDVGEEVFTLGYPLTTSMGDDIKLTNGIISAASGYKGDASMYQITTPIQPGNSGGPLFNSDGSVVGIVCAKHADAENANYAVKVSYLYSLANSKLGIELGGSNKVQSKKLSKKVKKLKNYVYLIECSSK